MRRAKDNRHVPKRYYRPERTRCPRCHHVLKRAYPLWRKYLGQARTDEQGQAPQTLRVRDPLPEGRTTGATAVKSELELALKFHAKDGVVLGRAQ